MIRFRAQGTNLISRDPNRTLYLFQKCLEAEKKSLVSHVPVELSFIMCTFHRCDQEYWEMAFLAIGVGQNIARRTVNRLKYWLPIEIKVPLDQGSHDIVYSHSICCVCS